MADEQTDLNTQTTTAPSVQVPERKNIIALMRNWSLSRKIALGAVVAIATALFAVLILQASTAGNQLLYANLPAQDASQVTTWLKGQNIPYSLKNGGRDIWIPADQIYQSRLDLASSGLPSGGGVGFEIFDKQSFALTDYVQKVNMTRALQGELARTITSLEPVEATRVHLALPEKRLFNKQQKSASASVILTMQPGKTLSPKQVQGIVNLVAGSVPDLESSKVKVIDQHGVELDREQQPNSDKLLSEEMLTYQQEVENRLERRVQALLNRTMGERNAMVRISAAVDFAKVEETKEFFDADDPVIRSEQTKQEFNNKDTEGGIPGVESNMQGNTMEGTDSSSSLSKNSKITNYEISKTISRIINPIGSIKGLSVSVLVADKVISPTTEGGEPTTRPRTSAELTSIEAMVSRAIGLDIGRGDQITVQSMPFVQSPEEALLASPSEPDEGVYQYLPLIKWGLIALGGFLTYFLLIRPIVKTMKGEVKQHLKTVEEMEHEQQLSIEEQRSKERDELQSAEAANALPPADEAIMNLRREVMANQIPAAFILKHWIQEG
jgi:flagellar M-ring protein FliF